MGSQALALPCVACSLTSSALWSVWVSLLTCQHEKTFPCSKVLHGVGNASASNRLSAKDQIDCNVQPSHGVWFSQVQVHLRSSRVRQPWAGGSPHHL